MEWKAVNILLMIGGMGLIFTIIIIAALLAIFKPHTTHEGKVYNDDGTIDIEATMKKQIALGKRPASRKKLLKSNSKNGSFDLMVDDEVSAYKYYFIDTTRGDFY